ncbi:MAG TPA: hypothetical protein VFK79_05730 [Xanthobacteraceae bacterium]|nr:hypothetical protein [Xanthobacteraceae bacterium]
MNALPQAPVISPDQLAQITRAHGMVVQGRACDSCTLCCKVLIVTDFDKPAGKWCSHCKPGTGCGIHAMRPVACRGFYCEWMTSKGLGPEWKPERCKFVLAKTNEGRRLTAHVDPGYPAAWRASPYYQNFKLWAAEAVRQDPMHVVDVMIAERSIVILPDRDVEVGLLAPDELVELSRNASGIVSVERIRRVDYERAQAAI